MALHQVAMSPLRVVGGMRWLAMLAFCISLIGCSDAEPPAPKDSEPVAKPAGPTVKEITEKDLCLIVDQSRTRYRDVMERDGYLDQERDLTHQIAVRANRLRDALKGGLAVNWQGEVSRLQRTADGSAALSVRLPCNATLVTAKAIPESSPLFPTLRLLSEKTQVFFNGHLVQREAGESDLLYQRAWFREGSVSDWGSMNEPEFAFVFEAITP